VFPAPLRAPGPRTGDAPEIVHLFVRRFPAVGKSHGAVWLLAGGPGESGAVFYPLITTLRASFPGLDLLVPDHRGTGFSTRLCSREEAANSPGGADLVGEEWASCWSTLNAAPDYARAFSTTNAAHDLALLMAAVRVPGPVYV
jgi:pimeloyl-ACP methyl ester carboxylesterase